MFFQLFSLPQNSYVLAPKPSWHSYLAPLAGFQLGRRAHPRSPPPFRYNSYFWPPPLKENKTISDSMLALELFGFYEECLCAREMATLWFFLTALVYSSGGKPRRLREPRAASPPVPDVPKAGLCGCCSDSSTEGFFVWFVSVLAKTWSGALWNLQQIHLFISYCIFTWIYDGFHMML